MTNQRFGSVEVDQHKSGLIESCNDHFTVLELFLNNVVGSREKSIALTKLEEASMWVNKAIARGELKK